MIRVLYGSKVSHSFLPHKDGRTLIPMVDCELSVTTEVSCHTDAGRSAIEDVIESIQFSARPESVIKMAATLVERAKEALADAARFQLTPEKEAEPELVERG